MRVEHSYLLFSETFTSSCLPPLICIDSIHIHSAPPRPAAAGKEVRLRRIVVEPIVACHMNLLQLDWLQLLPVDLNRNSAEWMHTEMWSGWHTLEMSNKVNRNERPAFFIIKPQNIDWTKNRQQLVHVIRIIISLAHQLTFISISLVLINYSNVHENVFQRKQWRSGKSINLSTEAHFRVLRTR